MATPSTVEQKTIDEAVPESEKEYRTLVEQSPQGVAIVRDLRIIFANSAFARISGYTVDELTSLSPDEVKAMVHPDDQSAVWGRFAHRSDGKTVPARLEYRGIRKDGAQRWLEMFASCIEYKGMPAVQATVVDITERKRVEHEISHRTKQLALINEVGQTIAPILELSKLYRKVVEAVQEKFGYHIVAVFSVQEQEIVLEAVAGPRQESTPSTYTLELGESTVGRVAQSGEAFLANNITEVARDSLHSGLPETRSELAVPIRLGQKIIGVLDAQSEELGAFDASDLATLETLADALAAVIENARLYKEAWRQTQELSVLVVTAQVLNSSLDLEQVLESIALQAKALTRADGSRIYLLEPGQDTLKAVLVIEEYAEEIMATPVLLGQGVTGHVAATGAPEIVNHAQLDARVIQFPGRPKVAECLVCVPLVHKGEVIGVMTLSRQGEKEFEQRHLRLLTSLASQAATAIENARLFEETKRLAATDVLTGVWNRRHIRGRFRTEFERGRRFAHDLSVLVMDIDNLKLFNDTYGHSAGDEIIRAVAQAVLASVRDIDIVGRYGGDEFAAVIPEAGPRGARKVARRILAALERRPFEAPDGTRVPISISIGVASYPADISEADRLFSHADAAMYNAKLAGGARFATAAPGPTEPTDGLDAPFDVLKGLLITVDAKDHYTFKHSREVAQRALVLARRIGFSEEEMRPLEVAGQLHDVGKIGVRTDVLRKPGALTEEEWKMIRHHPRLGHMLLQQVPEKEEVLQAVLHHHERYDGMGYPDGLKGEEIPLVARILAVADAFSAMMTDRPYRKGLTVKEALDVLRKNAGKQFDPELAEVFAELVESGKVSIEPTEASLDQHSLQIE